jgi:hypothetical protein
MQVTCRSWTGFRSGIDVDDIPYPILDFRETGTGSGTVQLNVASGHEMYAKARL